MPSTSDRPAWLRVEVEFPPGLRFEEVAWSLFGPVVPRGLVIEDDPPRVVLYVREGQEVDWDAVRAAASRSGLTPPGWPQGFIRTREVDHADWAEAWKDEYAVLRVGCVVIVPCWLEHEHEPGDRVVRLEPGMGFGTGTHATTFGCLELVEGLFSRGRLGTGCRVLDVGTGSGILALACLELGAGEAWGIDADGVALENAAANARLNGAGGRLRLIRGPFPEAAKGVPPADLVLANLDPVQLARLAPDLRNRATSPGFIVLSGFTPDALPRVARAFSATGAQETGRREAGGWCSLLFSV